MPGRGPAPDRLPGSTATATIEQLADDDGRRQCEQPERAVRMSIERDNEAAYGVDELARFVQ